MVDLSKIVSLKIGKKKNLIAKYLYLTMDLFVRGAATLIQERYEFKVGGGTCYTRCTFTIVIILQKKD